MGSRQSIFLLSGYSRDRKSTRLNSSHQIISYAVFCLKKKILMFALTSFFSHRRPPRSLPSFPTRRSSDLVAGRTFSRGDIARREAPLSVQRTVRALGHGGHGPPYRQI